MMMRLAGRMMPSCKDITQLVSTAMDRKLPLRKRISIRLHVLMCSLCRRYEKQLHLLREGAIHYANPDEYPVENPLSPAAKEKLEKALADAGK